MIGSLLYVTASRPDIMQAYRCLSLVSACTQQVGACIEDWCPHKLELVYSELVLPQRNDLLTGWNLIQRVGSYLWD